MFKKRVQAREPRQLAAPCGLYCGNCDLYRAWADNNRAAKKALARELSCSVEETFCAGCRVEAGECWAGDCHFKQCTQKMGISFCHECGQFPCQHLVDFSEEEYHKHILQNLMRIKELGVERWLAEQEEVLRKAN